MTTALPSFEPLDGRHPPRPPSTAPSLVRVADRRDELIGHVVDGLLVERVVAEGGVGVVYAARELEGRRRFALKVPRARYRGDQGIEGRFEREARYGLRVRHPNVAAVRSHGRLGDGRPYLVTDLYVGATLGERVRTAGPLALARALRVADRILAGLGALHDAGIVHRDLQPDNVMLVEDREGGDDVRLLDLGFAHEPGVDTGDGVTEDSPGALVGTLLFMPPEQATRSRAITARTDLFAAAMLVYYALTGKLPFRGKGDLAVLVAIVRSAPVPLRRERRDLPRQLDDVLLRALSKHPDARYASAAEMRAALAAVAS
jgi:serine/threonine-protein kinase